MTLRCVTCDEPCDEDRQWYGRCPDCARTYCPPRCGYCEEPLEPDDLKESRREHPGCALQHERDRRAEALERAIDEHRERVLDARESRRRTA